MSRRRYFRWFLPFLLACLLSGGMVFSVRASVTLSYFGLDVGTTQVVVRWITATELETVAFYVNRSSSENGVYQRISAYIETEGDAFSGSSYQFVDTNVITGATYYYKLETISNSSTSLFYGPLWATPGILTPTPSLTSTRTPTFTPTPSPTRTATNPTGSNPTHTSTFTPSPTPVTPTNTPLPLNWPTLTPFPTFTQVPATVGATLPPHNPTLGVGSTQIPAATNSLGEDASPFTPESTTGEQSTATMIPMPTFQVLFSTPTSTPQAIALMATADTGSGASQPSAPPRQLPIAWIAGGLLFIWLGLGVWLVYTLRRLN